MDASYSWTKITDVGAKPLGNLRGLGFYATTPVTISVEFVDEAGQTIPFYDGNDIITFISLNVASGTAKSLGALLGAAIPWVLDAELASVKMNINSYDADGTIVPSYGQSFGKVVGGFIRVRSGEGTYNTAGNDSFKDVNNGFSGAGFISPSANTPRTFTTGDIFAFGRVAI
jgi:hypothetical protein